MSNTVITNYTDLNGPSTKADNSVVVIVNKDGSLSVDQKLLGTLMGTDGAQAAGISVVRVGHEGKPDDATDSESDDDKVPHVTLSVDSYYDEPNSIIKYDSGAEMLQSLRIETRENSLLGFQNDHCYTPLTSPSQGVSQTNDNYTYDEPVIEITHTPPPKPIPQSKKITILEQQIIPKGKKIAITSNEASFLLKGNDVLNKPLPILGKSKIACDVDKNLEKLHKNDENTESSSISSSGDSIPDRDSDSDYKDTTDRTGALKLKKAKLKPRILKSTQSLKNSKLELKAASQLRTNKTLLRREIKEKIQQKGLVHEKKQPELEVIPPKDNVTVQESIIAGVSNESLKPTTKQSILIEPKSAAKLTPKPIKKEKKTPAHVTALLSDMTSLFSTPDVIRRVSTDKMPSKPEKETPQMKKPNNIPKTPEVFENKLIENAKVENLDKPKTLLTVPQKPQVKQIIKTPAEKLTKGYDPMPQLDDASLAQILQDSIPTGITQNSLKNQPSITTSNSMNSPGLAGPLSPTLDLLGGLQPEEEGLTEDLLMHVAQLVESSENLQEVIDKQVLGKVDNIPPKVLVQSPFQQAAPPPNLYTPLKTVKAVAVRKDPIEIVRKDGRVITLPPIEAPATRASKRKSQVETTSQADLLSTPTTNTVQRVVTPEPQMQPISKQYVNKKLNKKPEPVPQPPVVDKVSAESQESWNSEDDPNRLWCICKQPHNNRFMICCDSCEDWFHGKCVNITKAMGQQMEEQGIEWRCPNCIKKSKPSKPAPKSTTSQRKSTNEEVPVTLQTSSKEKDSSKTSCIVCKKSARASSIYCSDACILKHAQDSLGNQTSQGKSGDGEPGKSQEKIKTDSRVIVYERKSGRLLAGPNAPTAENLKSWLQKNPTFEVVRPGALSSIKPNVLKKKANDSSKIQTTLNFERIPKKSLEQSTPGKIHLPDNKEKLTKVLPSPKEEVKLPPQPKTPVTPKVQQPQFPETPKASTSSAKTMSEPRKLVRSNNRSQSMYEKAPSVSPSTSRRKDSQDNRRMQNSAEPIRENVRKALQEQIGIRMTEDGNSKFTEDDIHQFAIDTESELHELFKDVGIKYKAKYRSLMFNIKDRKNLSLWQKICDRDITPKQLVRLSPEELASQELAQWRDKEAKHQLELIKKSELDLLAASKTYVLKTHKGEEVMETKESVSTELDPNVPVEDVVIALNDSTVGEEVTNEVVRESTNSSKPETSKKHGTRKRDKEDGSSKKRRESKRDSENRKSRSSRRRSDVEERQSRSRRSEKKRRSSSVSKDKGEAKEKTEITHRSRSRAKKRSKSQDRSRSISKGRERSSSRGRSKRRSGSKEDAKRLRSRSKHSNSTDEKVKHRSRSQEAVYNKSKNDSTDSDSVERPKSAMQKEVHPEYDPHEPMITSAFSEEDLRKSREDVYEDNFKGEINEFEESEYGTSKPFNVDDNNALSPNRYSHKEKASEVESDQEPSSTVESSSATVWSGCINMVDVARFYVAAHEVSGSATDLEEDLSAELDIVGRINPDTVWDYISKMKRASNKDIVILRLQAANDEEKMQYIALYSYLSGRNRLGVVKVSNTATVKDFYIVPLPANTALPSVLLPMDGPGLGEVKNHLLIAIIIRQRKKRGASHFPKEIIPAKVARESRKRSYTPPVVPARSSYTPPTSPRRRALPLPAYTSPALSSSVKDKIAASLAGDDDEAYSPGSSSSGGSVPLQPQVPLASNTLRTKMEELNRQIEEQKQQILKMTRVESSTGEDEAYSPSRPMTPPSVVPLADIALPSNLHEILATIKQRENTTSDIDMRTLPLP